MARPSRDSILIDSARLWATRSTCSRLGVGAVFARDGRILVTGYNGAPAGMPHCDHTCTCYAEAVGVSPAGKTSWGSSQWRLEMVRGSDGELHNPTCKSLSPCLESEHAERNGIAWAARNGVKLEGSELFVTHMPCLACAMSLINAGISRVVYDEAYRDDSGVRLLRQASIVVDQWNHV